MLKALSMVAVCTVCGYVGYSISTVVAAYHEPVVLPPPNPATCKAIAGIYGDAAAWDFAFADGKPAVAPRFLKHLTGCAPDVVAAGVADALGDLAGAAILAKQRTAKSE